MRKIISLILIFSSLLGLCACGTRRVCALPEAEDEKLLAKRPLPVMSGEESLRMARHMCANRVWVDAEAVFTLDFDENYQPVLASYRREAGALSDFRILVRDCVPESLTMHEGKLYYINALGNGRLECFDPAAGQGRVLIDSPCSGLSIRDGRLYYRNDRGNYCSAAPDGSDERVIIGRSCRYVWPLGEALIFQDETDGDRLHLIWSDTGEELRLTDKAAYAPLQVGDRLFFSTAEGISSMSIDGFDPVNWPVPGMLGAAELLLDNGRWKLRALGEDYGFEQRLFDLSGGGETMLPGEGYRWCDYADGGCRVDAVYFADGRLRDFELIFADGSSLRYISGICRPG